MTRSYSARGTSPGAAAAPAWRPRRLADTEAGRRGAATADEVRAAFAATALELEALATAHRTAQAAPHADILEAEAMIARDPSYGEQVVAMLADDGAVAALRQVTDRLAAAMADLGSAALQERAADIRQVGRMVEDRLLGRSPAPAPDGPFVLVDQEISAPDLLVHAEQVAAGISVAGGPNSHASIVARSLGIPMVVGAPTVLLDVADGEQLLVDGDDGEVVVQPDAARLDRLLAAAVSDEELAAARALPVRTRDGVDVTLLANVASAVEARRALEAGAAGVGLLRTELAFLDATRWPGRGEHERALRPIIEALAGRPVTVRLLDFTNDKMPPFLADRIGSGRLGPSSLSLLLADPDALDAQLAAALAVADTRDLRVLVPMVERADELLTVQRRLASVAERLGVDAPMLGAMIESPEGVDALPTLVELVDFFSLGTNDLTAATLGVARTDERVGPAQAARPDVLRQIDRAVRVTAAAGRPLSVCGDAAADPAVLPLLLGTGLTTLSVAPSRLDAVRAAVRSVDVGNCRTRVAAVLAGGSPTDLVAAGVSRG